MRLKLCLPALLTLLAASAVAPSQENPNALSPEARQVLFDIVSDPRYPKDHPEKYVAALPKTAFLKQKLQTGGLVDNINYVYGWNLPATGPLTGRQGNDLTFEIVTRPRYVEETFLSALRRGVPLLRDIRTGGCVGKFNRRFNTDIPEAGGLSTQQAEKFLYEVVAKPGFDPARALSGICAVTSAAVNNSAADDAATSAAAQSRESPAALVPSDISAPATQPDRGLSKVPLTLILVIGGICIIGLIVIVILKLAIELKRS